MSGIDAKAEVMRCSNLALVGLVVLQIRGHKITAVRLLVPMVLTVWAASQFLDRSPPPAAMRSWWPPWPWPGAGWG